MSKKVKDNDFICLSAILRVKEARMLSGAGLERMLTEAEYADACRVAADAGYEDMSGMGVAEINASLAAHRAAEMAEAAEMIPDPFLLDMFRCRYDFHNAKALVKALGDPERCRPMFSDAARFSPEELLEVYRTEAGNGKLPAAFAEAIREAREALAHTGNPQLADYILDKAYFAALLREAKKSKKPYITDYARMQIDKANLRSILRTDGMARREALLKTALIEGGTVPTDRLLAATDREALVQLFSTTVFARAAALTDMTSFEKEADNAVREYVLRSSYIPFGPEIVLEYLCALENEIMSLRIILTGKRMSISEAKLRERLRESYV